MARKTKGEVFGAIAGIVIGVSLIIFFLRSMAYPHLGIASDVIAAVLLAFVLVSVVSTLLESTAWGSAHFQRRQARARAREQQQRESIAAEKLAIAGIIQDSLETLRREHHAAFDRWGQLQSQKWEATKHDFVVSVVKRRLQRHPLTSGKAISAMIDAALSASTDAPIAAAASDTEDEARCASALRNSGWDVQPSNDSRGPGVDLIATKDARKVALQCKRFSSPVSDSVIHEVVRGAARHGANASAIVSGAGYTAEARALANSTMTLLLSHEQVGQLEAQLDGRGR